MRHRYKPAQSHGEPSSADGKTPESEAYRTAIDRGGMLEIMVAGYGRFFRMAFKTYFRSRGTPARLSLKRLAVVSGAIPLLCVSQLVNWICFFLDEVFFPGYRDVPVRNPVFLVGVPRSGTTLLHRVFAKDSENFTAYTLWEETLAPSIVQWKFWCVLGKLDNLIGGPGHALAGVIGRRMFREISKIHSTGLFLHEEDELLLYPTFATFVLIYLFPFEEEFMQFSRFDQEVADAEKERIMRFYKSCILRHLYIHGAAKHYLTKNTLSTTKIQAIRKTFPDAKIVYSVRSPYEAVPSILSLANFLWRQFDNAVEPISFRDRFLPIAHAMYTHPMKVLSTWEENGYAIVRYDDLKLRMPEIVTDIYARFGFDVTPGFEATLIDEQEKSAAFASKHSYSMEAYALTPEMIHDRFGEVFEYFDFPTDYNA